MLALGVLPHRREVSRGHSRLVADAAGKSLVAVCAHMRGRWAPADAAVNRNPPPIGAPTGPSVPVGPRPRLCGRSRPSPVPPPKFPRPRVPTVSKPSPGKRAPASLAAGPCLGPAQGRPAPCSGCARGFAGSPKSTRPRRPALSPAVPPSLQRCGAAVGQRCCFPLPTSTGGSEAFRCKAKGARRWAQGGLEGCDRSGSWHHPWGQRRSVASAATLLASGHARLVEGTQAQVLGRAARQQRCVLGVGRRLWVAPRSAREAVLFAPFQQQTAKGGCSVLVPAVPALAGESVVAREAPPHPGSAPHARGAAASGWWALFPPPQRKKNVHTY